MEEFIKFNRKYQGIGSENYKRKGIKFRKTTSIRRNFLILKVIGLYKRYFSTREIGKIVGKSPM